MKPTGISWEQKVGSFFANLCVSQIRGSKLERPLHLRGRSEVVPMAKNGPPGSWKKLRHGVLRGGAKNSQTPCKFCKNAVFI